MLPTLAMSALLLLSGSSLVDASPIKVDSTLSTIPATVDAAVVEIAEAQEKLAALATSKVSGNRRQVKRSTVSVPLVNAGGLYVASLAVGTPSQALTVLVDTGSVDLLTFTDGFNPNKSSTFKEQQKDVTFSFLSGSATGSTGNDTVLIGAVAVKQTIGTAPAIHGAPGGILGLGPSGSPSTQKIAGTTLFDNLVASGKIASTKFGVFLGRAVGSVGELTLGGFNPDHYTGAGQRVPVVDGLGRWVLQITNFITGSTNKLLYTYAIIDTASTVSYVPKEAAASIYAALGGELISSDLTKTLNGVDYTFDEYVFPCNATVSPSYNFNLGQRKLFKVNPTDMNLGNAGNGFCYGSILGVDIELYGAKMAVLGTDFLKSWYSVFDSSDSNYNNKPTITFYAANQAAASAATTTAAATTTTATTAAATSTASAKPTYYLAPQ